MLTKAFPGSYEPAKALPPDLSDGRTNSLYSAAISGDGSRVVFSTIGRLAAGDTGSRTDVYVRDLPAGSTTLVSVTAGGQSSDGTDELPTISADGTRVAWWSTATNLASGDTTRRADVLVRDRSTGTTTQASLRSTGQPAGPVNPVAAPATPTAARWPSPPAPGTSCPATPTACRTCSSGIWRPEHHPGQRHLLRPAGHRPVPRQQRAGDLRRRPRDRVLVDRGPRARDAGAR